MKVSRTVSSFCFEMYNLISSYRGCRIPDPGYTQNLLNLALTSETGKFAEKLETNVGPPPVPLVNTILKPRTP